MAGPTPNPFRKAFTCAVAAYVVIYAGLWLGFGAPADAAFIAGLIAGLVAVPAIIVGFWASKSAKDWSLFRIIVLYILFLAITAALYITGTVSNPPR
jgi:hypothetical protein